MKQNRYATYKKVLAVSLSVVFFCIFLFSIISIAIMASVNYYNHSRQRVRQDYYSKAIFSHLYSIVEYYEKTPENQIFYTNPVIFYEDTNLAFSVTNKKTGAVVVNTYQGGDIIFEDTVALIKAPSGATVVTNSKPAEEDYEQLLSVTGYIIPADSSTDDLFSADLRVFMAGYSWRYPLIAIAFVSFAALAFLLIYLFFAAGHRPGSDEIRESPVERLPFDVFTIFYLIAAVAAIFIVILIIANASWNILTVSLLTFIAVCAYLVTLLYGLSFAVRIKRGGMRKKLLVYRIGAWTVKTLSACFRGIPLIWKTLIALALYGIADIIFFSLFGKDIDISIFYYIVKNLLVAIIILYITASLRKLQKGGEKIASGDLSYQIDPKYLFGAYEKFAHTLNSISDHMSDAVEERIKSERMKTELITNVSHDIKTPLTSIINYVDLLKKEDTSPEKAAEYLNILDHQSQRLKKLICDLVEVSKASTGNIQVNLEECDVCVLLQQAVGEYDEKLRKAGLEIVTHISQPPILLMADGNLLWRVFDNLLGNICKYSLSGTRVYLEASAQDGFCTIHFKNISKSPLGESCEEFLERFVRGDASRNTEGSGLGLSIAQSLLALQGGALTVSSDGDLFKATVRLPLNR